MAIKTIHSDQKEKAKMGGDKTRLYLLIGCNEIKSLLRERNNNYFSPNNRSTHSSCCKYYEAAVPSCQRWRAAEHLRAGTLPRLLQWMYLVLEAVSSALVHWAKGTVILTLITLLMATITTPLKSSALMS